MSGVNKVILIGNLGADPEVRHLQNDVTVANFNLATSETYKDRQTGEKREQTEWERQILARSNIENIIKDAKLVERWDEMRPQHRRLLRQLRAMRTWH